MQPGGAPDLIIFDCDGVLVDSEVISLEVLTLSLARHGLDIGVDEAMRRFVGYSFSSVRGMIREADGTELPIEFEESYRGALLERFAVDLHPTPGVVEFLDALEVPTAVATSSSPQRVARSLEICGLAHHFGERVFSAAQVARGKPAPDLFLHVSETLGVPPAACLVVEDSLPGIAAARAAGMRVLRYLGGAHLGGRHGERASTPEGITVFDSWADFPDAFPGGPAEALPVPIGGERG